MFSIGLYGDKTGFWSTRPFLTNIVTAATGACAGIPVAVGIIQRITTQQEERRHWKSTLRALSDCVRQMRTAIVVTYNFPTRDIEDLCSLLKFCITRSEQLLPHVHPGVKVDSLYADELRRFEADLLELQAAIKHILPDEALRSTMSTMYHSAWESLDQYVRPRIQELQGRWLDTETYITLKTLGFPYAPKDSSLSELDTTINTLRSRIKMKDIPYHEGPASIYNLGLTKKALEQLLVVKKLFPRVENIRDANMRSPTNG